MYLIQRDCVSYSGIPMLQFSYLILNIKTDIQEFKVPSASNTPATNF